MKKVIRVKNKTRLYNLGKYVCMSNKCAGIFMKMPNGEKNSLHELIGLLIFVKAIFNKIAVHSTSLEIICAQIMCRCTR